MKITPISTLVFIFFGFFGFSQSSEFDLLITLNNAADSIHIDDLNDTLLEMGMTARIPIQRAYPGTDNPELNNVFHVVATGNQEGAIMMLESSTYFESIIVEEEHEHAGCTSPATINDAYHVNNWVNNNAINQIDAKCAWSLSTGNSNVFIGIGDTEFDLNHEDLNGRIASSANIGSFVSAHGTSVSGCAAANTNNGKGVASIGYNCRLKVDQIPQLPSGRARTADIRAAFWALYQAGVDVLNVSWTSSGLSVAAAKQIVDDGVTIVTASGNDRTASSWPHASIADIPGVVNVSGVDANDNHGPTGHVHNSTVDLSAPSTNVSTTARGNAYTGGWGTSFAAPLVAGTVGLMKSVNSCLSPQEIELMLEASTDPIGDASSFPGEVGTGRLNSYEAVKVAQNAYSNTLDLYIKDRYEDFGDETFPYHWQSRRDESPDIWVRNQQDGLTNFESQDPEYQAATPVYIYVRVRNKSCVTSAGTEKLAVYWTKASTWTSWPANWDGSSPTVGNQIHNVTIPQLGPGEETIIEIPWSILNPNVHNNWATCLLARIENSSVDGITIYPSRQDDDVFFNNNVAMRNLTIVDLLPGIAAPGLINGIFFPFGRYVSLGNPNNSSYIIDINFRSPAPINGNSLVSEAEVKVIFDQDGWNILETALENHPDIEVIQDREVHILAENVTLSAINVGANTQFPVYIGANFLTEEVSDQYEYKFEVTQELNGMNAVLGGETFIFRQPGNRNLFYADAGINQVIQLNESVDLVAADVLETAIYNWYDGAQNLVGTGREITITPTQSEIYTLEVTAESDGYKDYDEVSVLVSPYKITGMSPNPAQTSVTVNYTATGSGTSKMMILNHSSTSVSTYMLDPNLTSETVDVSGLIAGLYSVVLICDGVSVDAELLVIQ